MRSQDGSWLFNRVMSQGQIGHLELLPPAGLRHDLLAVVHDELEGQTPDSAGSVQVSQH